MLGNVVSPHTPLPHVCPTASGWGIKNLNNNLQAGQLDIAGAFSRI